MTSVVPTPPEPRDDTKFDAKRDLAQFYSPKNQEFERVVVPRLSFLAIDGDGDPDGPDFAEAITALYSIAYPHQVCFQENPRARLRRTAGGGSVVV